jgi:surfactin synthase thioesterase subunit
MKSSDSAHWLRIYRPVAAPRVRLVCFPYAGGGAPLFHKWASLLPPEVEVRCVQPPGRQDRLNERPLTQMGEVVAPIEAALTELPMLPTLLFGHSLGGLVAFEVARRLQAAGASPVALVVGATRGPTLPLRDEAIHSLPKGLFLEAIHGRYGTPWSLLGDDDLMGLALPSLRADLEVLETYRHEAGPPLALPITALRGLQDPRVTAEDIVAWQHVTSLPLKTGEIDAGHLFVDSRAQWVIDQVKAALPAS